MYFADGYEFGCVGHSIGSENWLKGARYCFREWNVVGRGKEILHDGTRVFSGHVNHKEI